MSDTEAGTAMVADEPLTNQTAFNRVWEHFVVKGMGQSVNGSCLYRSFSPSSPCCAVGLLIPDALYRKEMEGIDTRQLLDENPSLNNLLLHVDDEFLADLQFAHDTYRSKIDKTTFRGHMRFMLKGVAKDWKLTIPGEKSEAQP